MFIVFVTGIQYLSKIALAFVLFSNFYSEMYR